MRLVAVVVAIGALLGARAARSAAKAMRDAGSQHAELPFAPSEGSAPFLSLGYREAAADLLYVRMLGYFMTEESDARGVADLAEAVVALDPQLYRAYDTGANAMTLAKHGVGNDIYLRAIGILERGMAAFPDVWRLPYLAGQIYTQDLTSKAPELKRKWDEKGTLLVESAIRKPGAPLHVASWAAMMRTKLGQHERAAAGLRELLLVTSPGSTRDRLIATLAELEKKDAATVAAEIHVERLEFERRWKRERPFLSPTVYILLGPRVEAGFDMYDLATGGRELLVPEDNAELEPIE